MSKNKVQMIAQEKAMSMYNDISEDIKEDIGEAHAWAKEILTNHEGSGHSIYVTAGRGKYDGLVQCSFAKPSWSGDHCGSGMENASEAIVMAVCEYLNGM